MPQSLSNVVIHTIFSTKNREPFLNEKILRAEIHAYLGGIGKKLDCNPIQIGGVADHVHLLTALSRTATIADFVKELKRVSTNWIRDRGGVHGKFQWQSGYGVFSVSQSKIDKVVDYIRNQEERHRIETFQDEFRRFLRKYQIEFNERYVWD